MAEAEAAAFPLCTGNGRINKKYIKSPCGIVKLVQISASVMSFFLMMITKDRSLWRGIPFTLVTVVAIVFTATMLVSYLFFFVEDPSESEFSWLRLQLYFCLGLAIAYFLTICLAMGQTVLVSFAAGLCLIVLICAVVTKKRSEFGGVLIALTSSISIVFTVVIFLLYIFYVVEDTDEFTFSYLRLQFSVCLALAICFLITSSLTVKSGGALTAAAVFGFFAMAAYLLDVYLKYRALIATQGPFFWPWYY